MGNNYNIICRNLVRFLKLFLGCSSGEKIPSPYDSCNTCICGEDGDIGVCTRMFCNEGK